MMQVRRREDTYSRVAALEHWLDRIQKEFQIFFYLILVAVLLFPAPPADIGLWSNQHRPGVAKQQSHQFDLAPLIKIHQDTAQSPVVRVDEVQAGRADRLERDRDAAQRQRRAVPQ